MSNLKQPLPPILEPYGDRIEATIKPYLDIRLVPDDTLTWWNSKFPGGQISRAGLPYLPKGMSYPQTPEGEYLHLLAQINFAEAPSIEPFPQQGILQFFIANCDSYGCPYPYQQPWKEFQANWFQQTIFRIRYFPQPDLNEANLETNFDFLPDKNPKVGEVGILCAYPSTCSAIQWSSGKELMPLEDYQFYDVMFHDLDRSDFVEEEEFIEEFTEAYETYRGKVALEMRRSQTQGSIRGYTLPDAQIGGYTLFPQADPRESSTDFEGLDEPLDTILLKIPLPEDVLLFYIQRSDLIRQDFSRIFYSRS
ncbi:YwqG family protein [Coleofasciculus sp. E1-EBD-02]|jgi:uncharacterized protein YwqG|uniref:YwqG family protein n=1 Tax=Coleofasciculus sp. E1-EBD-02 TaxID=3068481 RepID=UPI0032F0A494